MSSRKIVIVGEGSYQWTPVLGRDLDDAAKMLDEMLEATKEYLPRFFGKKRRGRGK